MHGERQPRAWQHGRHGYYVPDRDSDGENKLPLTRPTPIPLHLTRLSVKVTAMTLLCQRREKYTRVRDHGVPSLDRSIDRSFSLSLSPSSRRHDSWRRSQRGMTIRQRCVTALAREYPTARKCVTTYIPREFRGPLIGSFVTRVVTFALFLSLSLSLAYRFMCHIHARRTVATRVLQAR